MKVLVSIGAGVVFGAALLFFWTAIWSFSAQHPNDYAREEPKFDLRQHLNGPMRADGLIYDYRGRVTARFSAEMLGDFKSGGGTISETFSYASGVVDTRKWTITHNGGPNVTATAPDVVGTARGTLSGNTLNMHYRLRLPERAGGHVVDVVDWMYLLDGGLIFNRAEMRKFGIKVGEFIIVIQRADASQ